MTRLRTLKGATQVVWTTEENKLEPTATAWNVVEPLEPTKEVISTAEVEEKDYRGLVAGLVIAGTFGLVGASMFSGKPIPDVFLGALTAAWGAVVAWYFQKK